MTKEELEKENKILKLRLNDIIFDDANDDVELGARYLRKIGYIDFDEERKVYVNKHNEEPFLQEDEREKDYYIQDEELNEYIKQLEYKLQQKENIIKEVREYIENNDLYEQDYDYDYEENLVVGPPSDETARKILLEILDKEGK